MARENQPNRCHCTNSSKTGRDKQWSQKYIDAENYYYGKYQTNNVLHKTNATQSSKKNVSYPILSKSRRNKKSGNKSIISLHNNRSKKRFEDKYRNMYLQTQEEYKLNPTSYQLGKGDPGNTNVQYLTKNSNADQLKKDDKHKKNKIKSKINKNLKGFKLEDSDQTQRNVVLKNNKVLNNTCQCKHDDKNTKQSTNAVDQKGEPFFELKVNKQDMHVLNANEVKDKVKTLGILRPRDSCICPSHRDVCIKGICEKNKKNKQTNFNCNCKKGIAECSDQTCDSKRVWIQGKRNLFRSSKLSRPLFEVRLDSSSMTIVNTDDIKEIFAKSNYGVCPTGVCSKAKHKNMVNCKCINKKIMPKTTECTEKTCYPRKCNLYDICSKVLISRRNSRRSTDKENNYTDNLKINPIPRNDVNLSKDKAKPRTEKHKRNGVNIKISEKRDENHAGIKTKPNKIIKLKDNDKRATKKKKKISKCCRVKKRKTHSTYLSKIVKCLKRKRERCEKKIKIHEKAIIAAEKKADKKNRLTLRNIDKLWKQEEAQWNCITKFLAGIINLIVETVKSVISTIFSLVFAPIKSIVYIKRRMNDPNSSLARFCNWVRRVWGNRSNKISRKVKNIAALNIIADEIQESALYEVFADKGRTKEEKARYEANTRKRRRRMQKRDNEARFGCRNILLTTLRKTPCLCCYYLSPDLYPACLGLINFMKTFFNAIIYLLAFICWTPCILSFEICRACLCCLFCTG